MTSVQERLKLKRTACDTWSTREQLCLASSVLKSGDQNWMSVSRSIKPLLEKDGLRPTDWFSQKSCAIQYAHLLENADTPKRKKRESGETTGESIVRRLTQERITELGQILNFQKEEYKQLKSEISMLKSGGIAEEKLQIMWVNIEQEEKDQEQKAKAHLAWLAKRQQKQEANSPLPVLAAAQQKHAETPVEPQQQIESVDEEEKKNRGGRSPLLTSLLKSPSPTTQIQTTTPPIQASSPTITSLLGSSPKVPNPQLTQNIPTQIHPIIAPAVATVPSERPSAGAPTLSMLLEMPANVQRGPLPNLQSTPSIVPQQSISSEVHTLQSQTVHQPAIQTDAPTALSINASTTIPVTESMVQIIDHLDDVIRKDIMTEVMDKDEINEIIDDIEELIKEEITGSPQTNDTTTSAITAITVPPPPEVPIIQERPEPRNVDDAVSLSNSPQSEMAIEEIDSSTSNIAEIIGTVAIEPQEPKVIVTEVTETVSNMLEESKSESNTSDESVAVNEELVPEMEISEDSDKDIAGDKRITETADPLETPASVPAEKSESRIIDTREPVEEDTAKEQEVKVEESEVIAPEIKESNTNIKEEIESSEELENKDNMELDQLELHLAKITGEPQEVPPTDVASVSSEITNDLPSIEDTEKSQDISLILEDDESTHSSENKRKVVLEHVIDNAAESAESIESFKEEPVAIVKEETIEVRDTPPVKLKAEQTNETLEIYSEEIKKEDSKDSSEDGSSISQNVEVKGEEMKEPAQESDAIQTFLQESDKLKREPVELPRPETEAVAVKKEQDMPSVVKVEERKIEEEPKIRQESKVQEESKKDEPQVKDEKIEKKADNDQVKKEVEAAISTSEETAELEEEETSLSKLSAGRAMKTYPSKKHNTSVDSETETEGTGEGADYRAWKKAVMLVYNRLATHKYASIFLRPITEDQAPGYHSVIFRPMDLSTIKKNIDNGTIRSTMHFQRDVMLMFQNAIMYNKHDTFIFKMAVSMQEECLQHMQILVQVTGEGTLRRETRTATSCSSEISDIAIKRKRSHITPSPHDTESPRSKKRRKSEND